jgi:glycosyltransferase involved in cell wall biosynthesis
MKALFLAPESPYPAHGGGPMRSACILQWLAQRSEVHALLFGPANRALGQLCRHVEIVQLPGHSQAWPARAARNLSRAFRGVPPLVDRFFTPAAEAPLRRLLERGPFDLAIFEHFWTAPWIHPVRPHCSTAILDLHNREPEFCRALGGPLAGWFARCALRWERKLLPHFDQIWDPHTVPTGLPLRPVPKGERTFDLAFSGTLDYPPNRDALQWFFRSIWPRIQAQRPGTTCVVVGKNPPPAAALRGATHVTGAVEDALDWLGKARVAVVPLRRGAGVSVKITEAWQAGCAVVATSVGARGYHAPDALVMADSAEQFATTTLALLDDPARLAALAQAGRLCFEQEYSWPQVFARLDKLILAKDRVPA